MPNPRSRRLRRRWLPQALAVLLVVAQLQAAEQAAVPPQAPATAQQPASAQPASAQPASAQPASAQPASAQQPSTPPQQNPSPVQPLAPLPTEQSLKIRVLAGKDEMNDLERRVMAPLVVQVVDQNERPVESAEVVFRFPISGASATFPGGKSSVTVRTNGGGQAAAVNWMANGQTGTFEVHVSASYGNQVGDTTLSMTNVTRIVDEGKSTKRESLWSHRWFKIAVIGGAAAIAVGVVLATRGGSSGGSTVTISPGPPSVGGPH
jgi:hypothetical protein